jgi:hypothetical protein
MAALLFKFLYEGVACILWLWEWIEHRQTKVILGFQLVLALVKNEVFNPSKAEASSSLRYEINRENLLQVE